MTTATVTETCVELANGKHLDLAAPDPEVLYLDPSLSGSVRRAEATSYRR